MLKNSLSSKWKAQHSNNQRNLKGNGKSACRFPVFSKRKGKRVENERKEHSGKAKAGWLDIPDTCDYITFDNELLSDNTGFDHILQDGAVIEDEMGSAFLLELYQNVPG